LKSTTIQAGIYFYDLKTAAAIIFISNPNLRFRYGFGFALGLPNGLRYPRWGGRRNAVQLEKG